METKPITFATALNCMDGRVQLPVNEAVRCIFGVEFIDTITEAGIIRFLSDNTDTSQTRVALYSIRISLEKHDSKGIAIAAHYDCAGNPVSEKLQKAQLERAVKFLTKKFPDCDIVGLWVNSDWQTEIYCRASAAITN